jgi:hypothetical protein
MMYRGLLFTVFFLAIILAFLNADVLVEPYVEMKQAQDGGWVFKGKKLRLEELSDPTAEYALLLKESR